MTGVNVLPKNWYHLRGEKNLNHVQKTGSWYIFFQRAPPFFVYGPNVTYIVALSMYAYNFA